MVVGASRGLGRGVAEAFLDAGATTIALARNPDPLTQLSTVNPSLRSVAADASDPAVARSLLAQWRPDVLALIAGAAPLLRPIHLQTWESLSSNWQSDVRITFLWLREALLLPLRPGSRVIVMSSGAALMGSPMSGGYAGAKATQRFLATYASEESKRLHLDIGVTAVLPKLTPATELGRPAVTAYAEREGITEDEYLRRMGKPVTPALAGTAFLELAITAKGEEGSYILTADGLQAVTAPSISQRQPA